MNAGSALTALSRFCYSIILKCFTVLCGALTIVERTCAAVRDGFITSVLPCFVERAITALERTSAAVRDGFITTSISLCFVESALTAVERTSAAVRDGLRAALLERVEAIDIQLTFTDVLIDTMLDDMRSQWKYSSLYNDMEMDVVKPLVHSSRIPVKQSARFFPTRSMRGRILLMAPTAVERTSPAVRDGFIITYVSPCFVERALPAVERTSAAVRDDLRAALLEIVEAIDIQLTLIDVLINTMLDDMRS
ncbi:hypothetical protein L1987_58215 [Smallanthus sonchifolius]|uniref:Uncharacterized protein n=1 Tax=Smallanthus sonchifolius TaxID=185202 RepID=A0ACB9DFH9_9ASTR|nr:hypothetical protein L1987_58215 [Smallanthus sonchifolius]